MARPTAIGPNQRIAVVRSVAGAIAVDNASLIDANYPGPTYPPDPGTNPTYPLVLGAGAVDCRGFDTMWVGVEIVGGTAPTATIELLIRDEDAPDGSRWKRLLVGAKNGITTIASPVASDTGVLAQNSDFIEMPTLGRAVVYPRIKAVANSAGTTLINILMFAGAPRLLMYLPRV